MAQITVTFDSYEEMKTFAEELLGTDKVQISLAGKDVPVQTQSVPDSANSTNPAASDTCTHYRTYIYIGRVGKRCYDIDGQGYAGTVTGAFGKLWRRSTACTSEESVWKLCNCA